MKITLNEAAVHLATGGKEFDSALPTVVMLHGSGMDHRAFALQTRWFAFNGFSVIAPDFPGHSLSNGMPCTSIEESASWLSGLLAALDVQHCHLVGHSQGFLTALEFAAQHSAKTKSLIGIGTADAISVNPALIETAKENPTQAAEMMLQWGFGDQVHLGYSPTPGMQPIATGRQIMRANPLAEDLVCCANYINGAHASENIQCPAAMLLAGQDKMTPFKAGLATAKRLNANTFEFPEFGHMLPIEAPKQVLSVLKEIIVAVEKQS